MRAKQVTALMMAATLAVTSNGVTALAAPAADAATESAAVAEVTEEEVEETEDVVKSTVDETQEDVEVTATPSKTEATYGEKVTITTKLDKMSDKLTVDQYVLYADRDVVASNQTGTFEITPVNGVTYKVQVIFVKSGQQAKEYKEASVASITVKEATITASQLHVPSVATITNKTASAPEVTALAGGDAGVKEVTDALAAANEADKEYGAWDVAAKTLATGDNELTFTFTAATGKYVVTTDGKTTKGTYEAKANAKVVQVATGIKITDADGSEVSGNQELTTGKKMTLKTVVSPESGDNAVSSKDIQWSSSSDKVKVFSDAEGAVITAVGKTAKDEKVTITASVKDGAIDTSTGKTLSASFTVTVKDGISADAITFPESLPELTYNGKGDVNDYYEQYLKQLNAKVTNGEFSFANGTVTVVKTTDDASEKLSDKVKLVFTMTDETLNPTDGTKQHWDSTGSGNTITKEYDVTVKKQTVSVNNTTAITGKLESSYVAGTTLDDILKEAADKESFDIEWQKYDSSAKKWVTATTTDGLKVGSLSNYRIHYSLKESAGGNGKNFNYTLSGKEEDHNVDVSKIAIVAPELTVKAEDTTQNGNKTSTYQAGDTVTLKATADTTKIGKLFDGSNIAYQWYKLGTDGKYATISGEESETLTLSSVTADDASTYYCVVTAKYASGKSVNDVFDQPTAAQQKNYAVLVEETNKINVAVSGIKFTDASAASTVDYGETANVTASAKVTAKDLKSYRVYAKTSTTVDGKEVLGEAQELASKTLASDQSYRFEAGNTISEKVGKTLDAGKYALFIEAKTGSETVSYRVGDLTVNKKALGALDTTKLKAADITYGQKTSEAAITYNNTEINDAVKFAFVDDTIQKVGTYTALAVNATVDDNHTATGTAGLTADVTVVKAPLTVKADNVSVEQGNKAELTGTPEGLVGDDKVDVTYAVVDADGNEVADTSKLAVGTYKIKAKVAEQENYEVTTEDGILTVSDKKIAITGVTVNATALTLKVGESKVVAATVAPANTTESKYIKWTSDNTAVANVATDGTIYALKAGTANITATTSNGKTATVKVTVKAETSVKVSTSKVTLTSIGASKTVKATVQNADNKTVTWSSSNKKVATVDKNGKIVAKGNGKATITVKTADGKTATVKVTVKQATKKVALKVGKKVVTGKTYTLKKGKTATVKATVTDAKGKKVTSGNQKITWTTSNKKVATISKSGKITAKKAGTVKITAKTADGKKVTFKVKVK